MNNRSPARSRLIQFALLLCAGLAALLVYIANPYAENDNREIDQLFGTMGVVKVAPARDPVKINLNDVNGNRVSIADFEGKIVFLNFWTTWCPTCRIEMPSMEKLHQKLKHKKFAMVTVNLQESAAKVKAFFEEYKLTFTALLDSNGEVGVSFGIRAIPTTFILDRTGRIIGRVNGPREWDSKVSIALFEKLIDTDDVAASSITDK